MESLHLPYRINTENTKVKRFWDELNINNKLMTTQCKECKTMHWPPRSFCNKCYSNNLDWVNLPTIGTLVTFTNVTAPAEGFSKDGYILGIVALENANLQVFGQIQKKEGGIKQGTPVSLTIEEDEHNFKYFKFTLDK